MILVDIDGNLGDEEVRARFFSVKALLWPDRKWDYRFFLSPSGRGWHFIATIFGREIPAKEIVLAQLLCGSDRLRELANLRRIRDGVKDWNVLFKTRRERL